MMHGHEKSNSNVAVKPANKAEQPTAEQSAKAPTAAESVEPRTETEGNAGQQSTHRAQNRGNVTQALYRIRKVARERKKERFTTLFHHISTDFFKKAFFELKGDAAPDVEGLPDRPRATARAPAWSSPSAIFGHELTVRVGSRLMSGNSITFAVGNSLPPRRTRSRMLP